MSTLMNILDTRYHGSFTIMDVIKDPLIYENLGKMYVPQFEMKESIFFKKDDTIAVTETGPRKICYVYLNQHGKNITNPDFSYIQIPNNLKGFLARISISRNSYTPEYLQLDYLIDISKIKYRFDSELASENVKDIGMSVVRKEVLKFDNIEFSEYDKLDFDRQIKEFILHKGQIFATYFR